MLPSINRTAFTRLIVALILVSMAGVNIWSGLARAADFDLGAVDITTPTGEWMEILPSEKHMYEFAYDSFEQSDGYNSLAKVDVEMAHNGSVGFKIYSSKEINDWQKGGGLNPLGMGSMLSKVTFKEKDDKRLVWVNRTDDSTNFYVVVENKRNVASYYEIEIIGSGVALTKTEAMIAAEQAAAEAAAEAAEAAAAEAARIAATEVVSTEELAEGLAAAEPGGPLSLTGGFGPEDALPPIMDRDIMLEPGESRWFTFRYYKDAGKDATQVIAMLKMPIADTISFEIWNQDTVRKWANSEKFTPVGKGTPIGFGADFDRDPNTLVWVSSAEAGQQYFVVVKNRSSEAASFKMNVTGPQISY